MKRIAKFEKVSLEMFQKDTGKESSDAKACLENLKLPKRATAGSAGYDLFAWEDIAIPAHSTVEVRSGVRAKIENGWVLKVYPRSGLGFKYGIKLANTVGIIDSDYYHSDNEGHIVVKLTNPSNKDVFIKKGVGYAQGIFVEYGITDDDTVRDIRNGGFGSTTKDS